MGRLPRPGLALGARPVPPDPLIADLHQDLLFHEREVAAGEPHRQTSFEQLERSPVRLVVASTWPGDDEDPSQPGVNEEMEGQMREYGRRCAPGSGWRLVRSRADLDAVEQGSERGLVIHVEGLYRFSDGGLPMLERWLELGWRSLGIMWNGPSALGGGCAVDEPGLTRRGAEVLRFAQEHGVLVDLAHMNDRTFWGALELTRGPVVASHVNAWARCPHPRNLSDAKLRALAERGGVAGVVAVPQFVRRLRPRVKQLAQHAEHIAEVAGIDHVGIGSDFGGLGRDTIKGFDSVDRIGELLEELRERGWDEQSIEKLSSRNALRMLREVLPAA